MSDLAWSTPSATPMSAENWTDPNARSLAIHLNRADDPHPAEDGTALLDDDFQVLINGWREPLTFVVPDVGAVRRTWATKLDSHEPTPASAPLLLKEVEVGPQSIVVQASA